jgi:hypothetical protein
LPNAGGCSRGGFGPLFCFFHSFDHVDRFLCGWYVLQSGWTAVAERVDVHPTTGEQMRLSNWWIAETKR